MRASIIRWIPLAAVFTSLSGLGGCSGAESTGNVAVPPSTGGAKGGAPVSLGSGGSVPALGSGGLGGGANLGFGGAVGSGGAAGSSGAPSAGMACSAQTREGKRAPIDMYFLVDSSGSMGEDVESGNKWELVSGALVDFLNAPRNAELGTGIGYFPKEMADDCSGPGPDCVCVDFLNACFSTAGGSCSVGDYATPAVPLALTSNSVRVIEDLESHWVEGGTPTRPAVEGALQYLNGWAAQHPERKAVLVLATDGEPMDCDANTLDDVAVVAAKALAGPHAIKTFVIGVGDFPESLDEVARSGGTERAFLVDTNGDVATAFADALDQIRGAAVSCDFTIPSAGAAGQEVDPHQVNVRYTPKSGAAPILVPQTYRNDPNNCGASDGWYYDNPNAPTLIRLCESTCQAMNEGSIAVEFGCETVVQPPR